MLTWQAALLGLIEGLTEFLPVSSTGHLLVAQRVLGIAGTEAAHAFVICVQVGAIAAVVALYKGRLLQIVRGLAGRDADGRRLLVNLVVAFAPAGAAGLLFDKQIEKLLFGPWPVVGAWIVGGLLILLLSARFPWDRARAGLVLEQLDARRAFGIGLAQCLAMWPGTSRSLATIVAALLLGLSVAASIEFSFLLGALTLSAATGYTLLAHGRELLAANSATVLGVGVLAAFVSAWLSVRWLVGWLSRHGLQLFGWWRVLLGGAVAVALLAGAL